MPSQHRPKWADNIFLSDLIAFFLFSYNMLQICLWLKNGGLVYFYQKRFHQEVSFQVNIKYLTWILVFFIVVHDLLHFKSILNVFPLKIREETTPQSSCVLESSTTFDRQKFLHICASRKLFHYPKTLQIRKTSVYARIWIPFWSDKQR